MYIYIYICALSRSLCILRPKAYVRLICMPYMCALTGDSSAQQHVQPPRPICPYPYMYSIICTPYMYSLYVRADR